ncbi:MAG TPA: DUF1540 domain-containing protein [Candidatus Faecaligallichristensenella faecipullorum]|nr:DUF1540 domain-containing protein [Candidatus Faecaligallichristensenella faecipullorum]
MGWKNANPNIRCNVSSCSYHCDDKQCCSLDSIDVKACKDCHSGKADQESMCGSYKCK